MRKIIVLSMVTLDGVIQSPGSPEEDTANGFEYGGWVAPFEDEASAKIMKELMKPADLLLGRKTFQIWEAYWPKHTKFWPSINQVTKYVISTTVSESDWENTVFLDSLLDIKKLKNSNGSAIQVWGSAQLIQLLLTNDLVDELWLIIHPLTIGKGKKLFNEGAMPAAFALLESIVTPGGLIFVHYKRAGKIKIGSANG